MTGGPAAGPPAGTAVDVVAPSRADRLVGALSGVLGGPLGRRARRDPDREVARASAVAAALALVSCAVGWLLKSPCRGGWGGAGQPAALEYTHLCYSDVLPLYAAERLDVGAVPYLDHPVEYPVLLGGLMQVGAVLARAGSSAAGALGASWPESTAFFDLFALLLALGAAVSAVALVRLAGPRRPWDAVPFAAAPVLALHAATNWDLLAVVAACAGLLAWQRRAPLVAGVLLGVATCLKAWPVLLLGVLALLTTRSGRAATRALTRTTAGWLATCLAVYVPAYLVAPRFDSSGRGAPVETAPSPLAALGDGVGPGAALAPRSGPGADGEAGLSAVLRVVELNAERPPDWDSLWFVLAQGGFDVLDLPAVLAAATADSPVPGVGVLQAPTVLSLLVAGLSAAVVAAVVLLVRRAPVTPRVAQVAFLVLVGLLLVGKVFSPQFSLWLLPFAVLAVPRLGPLAVWQATEAVVWVSREWFFADMVDGVRGAPVELFASAVLLRDAVLVWLAVLVVRDVLRPHRDLVRAAHGGRDPAAGPLGEPDDPAAERPGRPEDGQVRDRGLALVTGRAAPALLLVAAAAAALLVGGRPASAAVATVPAPAADLEPTAGADAGAGEGTAGAGTASTSDDDEVGRRGTAAVVALVGVVGVGGAVARVAVADARRGPDGPGA